MHPTVREGPYSCLPTTRPPRSRRDQARSAGHRRRAPGAPEGAAAPRGVAAVVVALPRLPAARPQVAAAAAPPPPAPGPAAPAATAAATAAAVAAEVAAAGRRAVVLRAAGPPVEGVPGAARASRRAPRSSAVVVA